MTTRTVAFVSLLNFSFICFSIIFCSISSTESLDFEFDLKDLCNNQRDRLFYYLDRNSDKHLSKSELKPLLRQLFYSTKLNKTLVNDLNETKLFEALNLNEEDRQLSEDEFNNLWQNWIKVILKPRSALIVVDVQNDFISSSGTLVVPNGTVIIPIINELIERTAFDVIVYTQDWHPSNHCSFVENAQNDKIDRKIIGMNGKSQKDLRRGDSVRYEKHPDITQTLWPKHCVQNTSGAELYADLIKAKNSFVVYKGTDPEIDSYSAFEDNGGLHKTTLDLKLRQRGITDVYLSGVLYEYCVGRTGIDALSYGYRTAFVENAIQTADPEARDLMRWKLDDLSANLIQSDKVSDMVEGRDRTVEMGLALARKLYNKH